MKPQRILLTFIDLLLVFTNLRSVNSFAIIAPFWPRYECCFCEKNDKHVNMLCYLTPCFVTTNKLVQIPKVEGKNYSSHLAESRGDLSTHLHANGSIWVDVLSTMGEMG